MAVRDLLSNHKIKQMFPGGPLTVAVNLSQPIDLSLGSTGMFHIFDLHQYSSSTVVTSITVEFSDNASFPDNVQYPTVTEPLDPVTGLSTLGNSIYTIYYNDNEVPELITATANIGEDWGLPYDLGNFPFNIVANVVNPLGTYRYCRMRILMTLGGTDQERMGGYGFIGPVRNKKPTGGIA